MAIETLTQGNGFIRIIEGTAPSTRTDGAPLAPTDISHYNWYISVDGGLPAAPIATQLVAGEFTEGFDVDSQAEGVYTFYMTTVDTGGRESVPSNNLLISIVAPLVSAPNPPSNVS